MTDKTFPTVREVIAALEKYDPDLEVYVYYEGCDRSLWPDDFRIVDYKEYGTGNIRNVLEVLNIW